MIQNIPFLTKSATIFSDQSKIFAVLIHPNCILKKSLLLTEPIISNPYPEKPFPVLSVVEVAACCCNSWTLDHDNGIAQRPECTKHINTSL